ncbi:IS3 family transposase [Paenibacillus sp. NAIST15-1]|uniref:IS3 family transposase n=1 Tax=Paenibacillus sp. NAIST15-1 TaxID=1605994 RepID=UPI000869D5A9|nr:IS3 family transposase [Paenibacillus sp. NAIST15-1]GAV11626.1 putative transposase for insertion sequence element IS1353 [Paenibacillus sp. NAIST15-1]
MDTLKQVPLSGLYVRKAGEARQTLSTPLLFELINRTIRQFGHMKDELEYKDCTSIDELRNRINEYTHFYNTERYQWTLKKMTPNEYRNHLLAA